MKYIVLLRGINVGGNNKVPMKELKGCFEGLGFTNVQTYINSGNVILETTRANKAKILQQCQKALEAQFGFQIICFVISATELRDALRNAPKWWDANVTASHNALFVIEPLTPAHILQEVGQTNPEYEKVAAYGQVIFWSAPVKTFGRTRFSKIIGTPLYRSVTIRNANTAKKLVTLSQ